MTSYSEGRLIPEQETRPPRLRRRQERAVPGLFYVVPREPSLSPPGESAALRRVLKQVETVAPTDSTMLVRGETGTGKELIACALYELSPRRERTFVNPYQDTE